MKKFVRNSMIMYRLRAFRLHIVRDNDTVFVYRNARCIFSTTFADYLYDFPGT